MKNHGNRREATASKMGSYVLTLASDGTPLLHGPYATSRARLLVALQLAGNLADEFLFLVDYTARGLRVERFDATTIDDLGDCDEPGDPAGDPGSETGDDAGNDLGIIDARGIRPVPARSLAAGEHQRRH